MDIEARVASNIQNSSWYDAGQRVRCTSNECGLNATQHKNQCKKINQINHFIRVCALMTTAAVASRPHAARFDSSECCHVCDRVNRSIAQVDAAFLWHWSHLSGLGV